MGFPFSAAIPRWWLFGNPIPTHVANGLNLLFPDGERFFIRSVKHYARVFENDPELLARVRGFYGQEGRHGHEHERYNHILEEQGFDVDRFLVFYRKLAFGVLEPSVPPSVRLAVTAALEHLTASMADNGLRGDLMDSAHPIMRDLLKWHAAEEIEHKSVAFDVLQRVNPSWHLRAAGMIFGLAALLAFWLVATRALMAQEEAKGTDVREKKRFSDLDPRFQTEKRRRARMFRRAVRDYMRRDFHPDQHDNYALARAYLESIGRLDG
jgi:predicted metal-dependent hydrolase